MLAILCPGQQFNKSALGQMEYTKRNALRLDTINKLSVTLDLSLPAIAPMHHAG
ncbi:hypothetical protein [Nostoc sp. C052]|uniref:hypothetical protein n=1 Tax=Nostoc sp. C052 TaxID=2576902 RepID=UPI0015C36682|nr:hypothetical protein [Nostoc sp. C052]